MSAIAQIHEQKQGVGFKRVLIATDFSAASERALAYALPMVRRYGSMLSIVHAILPETRESITWDPLPRELDRQRLEAEQQMGRLTEEARVKDLNPHMVLEQGPVWDVLSSIIQSENTDLLVLGTHGRGGLKKLALGSVAEEALRLAPCPVLTIGPNVPPADPQRTEIRHDSICHRFWTGFGQSSSICLVPGGGLSSEAHSVAHGAAHASRCDRPGRILPWGLRRRGIDGMADNSEGRERAKIEEIDSIRREADKPTRILSRNRFPA